MTTYRFRLLNVFAEERLGGNQLCVFEDARGLDDATMQALARQFNLSETTFVLPSERAHARVRIFTPDFEMPFAGHPTLGSAHVVRAMMGAGDALELEMHAGVIAVAAHGDRWELRAGKPQSVPVPAPAEQIAAALGIAAADLAPNPRVVDTGSRQIVVPLARSTTLSRLRPSPAEAQNLAVACGMRDFLLLAWAWDLAVAGQVRARFFFPLSGAVREDPGTGSACANLGGWFIAEGAALPLHRRILQGEFVGRPCVLDLRIDGAGDIFVAGNVIELGSGEISL